MIIKLADIEELHMVSAFLKGKKKGLAHGCFDLLHAGHIEHLSLAKQSCDVLFVSVTPDKYVRKGVGRPIYTQRDRAAIIDCLGIVDYVVCDDVGRSGVPSINAVKPHLYFKGEEYAKRKNDFAGNFGLEKQAVEQHGGEVCFLSGRVFSSTKLSKQLLPHVTDAPFQIDVSKVQYVLDRAKTLKVAVLGEAIMDVYVQVESLGMAGKYPMISTRRISERADRGGVLAIVEQMKMFSDNVVLFSSEKDPSLSAPFLDKTVRKIRYVDAFKSAKLFEINEDLDVTPNLDVLDELKDFDLVLICDFGHGAFSPAVLEKLSSIDSFVSVMCQSNTANRKCNFLGRYEDVRKNLIVINKKEALLNAQTSKPKDAAKALYFFHGCDVCVTMGVEGAVHFDGEHYIEYPAVGTDIVDTIGCGDMFLLTSSMALALSGDPDLAVKLANITSYMYAQIDGNSEKLPARDVLQFAKGLG